MHIYKYRWNQLAMSWEIGILYFVFIWLGLGDRKNLTGFSCFIERVLMNNWFYFYFKATKINPCF